MEGMERLRDFYDSILYAKLSDFLVPTRKFKIHPFEL